MNPASPKFKSSRGQLINQFVQTLQVYSCQLFIDSFRISYRGFVYFLWVSESTRIQSLKYQSSGKVVQVKQALKIGVRLASKNGKERTLHTYLRLMNEQGQELDEFELQINMLTADFTEMEIPMDRGICLIKMRRLPMNIIEQPEQNYKALQRSNHSKYDEKMIASEYQTLQDELMKIKKQLEDEVYLNNKLKNDRDVLLTTKQELESEGERLLLQGAKEITLLRRHYDSRMAIRQHCYQEEIQDLLATFNSENQQTRQIMQLFMKEKEDQAKIMGQRLRKLEFQADGKVESLAQSELKIKQLMLKLSELQVSAQKWGNQRLLQSKQLNLLKNQIQALNKEIISKNITLQEHVNRIIALQSKIKQYQHLFNSKVEQMRSLELQHAEQATCSQQQNKRLLQQLEASRSRIQEYQSELQFNQNVIRQLKQQHQQKQTQLQQEIDKIENNCNTKIQELMYSFQQQYNYSEALLRQKEDKIWYLSNLAEEAESQIIQMRKYAEQLQAEQKNTQNSFLDKEKKLQNQIQALKTQQAAKYEQKIKQLQAELQRIKQELEQKEKMLQQVRDEMLLLQKRLKAQQNVIQVQSKNSNISIELSSQVNRLSQSQLFNMLNEKDEQISKLKSRVQELERLEQHLRMQLNSIQVQYPNMDEIEYSDNDSEEEIYFKRRLKQKQTLSEQRKPLSQHPTNIVDQYLKPQEQEQRSAYQQLKQLIQQRKSSIQQRKSSIQQQRSIIPERNKSASHERKSSQGRKSNQELIIMNSIEEPSTPQKGRKLSIGSQNAEIQEILSVKNEVVRSQKKIIQESRIKQSSHKQPSHHQTFIRQSIQKSANTIQIPRPPSLKTKGNGSTHSIKDDRSQISAIQVRVSCSKKVKAPDNIPQLYRFQPQGKSPKNPLNSQFQDRINLQSYSRDIQAYQDEIRQLKAELSSLRKSKSYNNKTQNQTQGQLFFRSPVIQLKKVSTESQVFLEDEQGGNSDHQLQHQTLELQHQKKSLRIAQLQQQVRQLKKIQDELQKQIRQLIKLKDEQGEGLTQLKRRQEQNKRKMQQMSELIQKLQSTIGQVEGKWTKERQALQQAKLVIKQTNLHYQNAQAQIKTLRSQKQTLQDNLRKMQENKLVLNSLNKQLEDREKKILELAKINNLNKLKNSSMEQQIRLLKKKQSEHARVTSELHEQISSLERIIEQFKRKQAKLKTQIQQNQQSARRTQNQLKKLQEEIQVLGSGQLGWHMERRKYSDEISSLQDQLARKDYEITKISREIEKYKIKAVEREEWRVGKINQRQQVQRLQNELIKKEKKIFQQSQQNKLLRARLDLSERQVTKLIQQKNQNFGQKLKHYIQQMASIKKLLDYCQADNSRLKMENGVAYQQFQLLRANYEKLQLTYNEHTEREEDILNNLQLYVNEAAAFKERFEVVNAESQRLQLNYEKLTKENYEEKMQNKTLAERLQNVESSLENALVEVKELKTKRNEYQMALEINKKNIEIYQIMEKQKLKLEQDYKKMKLDYEMAVSTFVYRREDMEKLVNEVKQKQRKLKEQEVQNITKQYNRTILVKTQRLQQEILQVYNENNKLKSERHTILEQNQRQKGILSQMQNLQDKIKTLTVENQRLSTSFQTLKTDANKATDKIKVMQITIQGLINEKGLKQRQLRLLERDIESVNEQLKMLDALAKSAQKEKNQHQLKSLQKENKITALQIENQQYKEKEAKAIQQNMNKMKQLQRKVDQMQQTLKQKEKFIQSRYRQDIKDLQNSLLRLSHEIQDKSLRNAELNEALLIIESENKRLKECNIQLLKIGQQEKKHYEIQLLKLSEKMKSAENAYNKNIKAVEEELEKNAKINMANSRVKSGELEERIAKRFEEKLKNRDQKINQMKQGIAKLQEKLQKYKNKEAIYLAASAQLQKARQTIFESQKEKKIMKRQSEGQIKRYSQLAKQLRQQILKLKQEEEKTRFKCQEVTLKYDNIYFELATLKQLYAELQRQFGRRQNNLNIHMDQESTLQYKLRMQLNSIDELSQQLQEQVQKTSGLELQLRSKNKQLKQLLSKISQLNSAIQQQQKQNRKLVAQLERLEKTLQQTSVFYESAKNELKLSKVQISNLRKSQQDLRTMCSTNQQISLQLRKEHEQVLARYLQCQKVVKKYSLLNSRSREEIGCELDQILHKYSVLLQEKDGQCNQMSQQIEELRFINERKHMDYNDLKKLTFQYKLKVEECQALSSQLQHLRRICDRLQEEKKNSVFSEQFLRLQMQSLAKSSSLELRSRIQGILSGLVTSYASFNIY